MLPNRFFSDRQGTAAIEFAILAPVFILLLLTLVAFGVYLSAASSVQQIAADAARAAVAGLNTAERNTLARDFIRRSTLDYYLLDPARLSVKVDEDRQNAEQFTVRLEYAADTLPIWGLYAFVMPDKKITRFSTIRIGGI
ncbi:MAG: pilus assembly protein [Rhizobiaceae bacterium]|nr:pilus assembly protein [Rhizobiaceae bacterium]